MYESVAKLKGGLTGLQSLADRLSYVSPTSPNTPSKSSKTNVGLLEEPKEYPPHAARMHLALYQKFCYTPIHTFTYLDLDPQTMILWVDFQTSIHMFFQINDFPYACLFRILRENCENDPGNYW